MNTELTHKIPATGLQMQNELSISGNMGVSACNPSEFTLLKIAAATKVYIYEPKEDITTYELALLLPMFYMIQGGFYSLEKYGKWNEIKRHFKVKE